MTEETAEQAFARDVERGNETLKREMGYNPTRWQQMVGEHGAVGAAKRLMTGPDTSEGFARLWEAGRLDMSVEWLVLTYADLFEDDERETAYRRLERHDAPVDSWLHERLGRRYP